MIKLKLFPVRETCLSGRSGTKIKRKVNAFALQSPYGVQYSSGGPLIVLAMLIGIAAKLFEWTSLSYLTIAGIALGIGLAWDLLLSIIYIAVVKKVHKAHLKEEAEIEQIGKELEGSWIVMMAKMFEEQSNRDLVTANIAGRHQLGAFRTKEKAQEFAEQHLGHYQFIEYRTLTAKHVYVLATIHNPDGIFFCFEDKNVSYSNDVIKAALKMTGQLQNVGDAAKEIMEALDI